VGKPERKRSLGRTSHRWKNNIKFYIREIGWGAIDRIHLALVRDQWWVLLNMINKLGV
jgi:hypothetical protein